MIETIKTRVRDKNDLTSNRTGEEKQKKIKQNRGNSRVNVQRIIMTVNSALIATEWPANMSFFFLRPVVFCFICIRVQRQSVGKKITKKKNDRYPSISPR